jgi:hypothetical protein
MQIKTKKEYKALRIGFFLLIGSFIALPFSSHAQEEERQYKIEAAFLYNFFNYITWPGYISPEALKRPTICFYDHDPVEPFLSYVKEKKAAERQMMVHSLDEGESPAGCNILFMRNDVPNEKVSKIAHQGILIISERKDALDNGAMIVLSNEEQRIVMRINQSFMEQDNFKISSRLLSLAVEVKR